MKTLLCLLLLLQASSGWNISYNSSSYSLEISLNGVLVIQHSPDYPCLFIGSGQTSFYEHHGNFDAEDYLIQRIPLAGVNVSGKSVTFSTSVITYAQITLEFSADLNFYVINFSKLPKGFDRIWVRFFAQIDERVYGGGEQFTYLNMKGRTFPIWTREQGVGRNKSSHITFEADTKDGGAGGDYHTTYYGEPTFLSSRGYLMHSAATWYTILDFRHDDFHEVEIHGDVGQIKFLGGNNSTLVELAKEYSKFSGLMPELPPWIFNGTIVGVQGGTKRMLEIFNKITSNDVSVSAMWIQDWSGKITTNFGQRVFWNWEWNATWYPDLDKEIKNLNDKGVKVLAYLNPYLNKDGPLFKEADALGHFVKNLTNQTNLSDFGQFYCGTIDLTNPAAVKWYKKRVIMKMLDLGISGYMADFSEYLLVDNVRFFSGQSALELHNQWPRLWAKLNREALEEAGKVGEVVFWMRAGYAGVSNYTTLMWAGDQNVDFSFSDGLGSTVPAALSMGLQGVGMTHFDVGGYTSLFGMKRTKELFLRSAEAAVFTPVMRTHEGNRPAENWQLYTDADTMKQYGRLVKIYKQLRNYTQKAIRQYRESGLALQRPLFLMYPADEKSLLIEHQYMYGDDVLVAPVLQANVTKWTVYLPPGKWKHLWSDRNYTGQTEVTVEAKLGYPPVFIREPASYWTTIEIPSAAEGPTDSTPNSGCALTCILYIHYAVIAVLALSC